MLCNELHEGLFESLGNCFNPGISPHLRARVSGISTVTQHPTPSKPTWSSLLAHCTCVHPVFRTLSHPSISRQRRGGTQRVFSAMAYTRHHSYPKYFYYGQGGRPTAPAYASKGNRPNESDIKNIRLKTSDYYLTRINADRRNRVMNQRSDYLFVDRKPGGVGDVIESRDSRQWRRNTSLQ